MVTYTKPQSDCNDYGHRAVGSGQGSKPYEKAFDIIKDYYMFMHEDDDALHFKHRYTRRYIKVEKVGL